MDIHIPFSLEPMQEPSVDVKNFRPEDVRSLLTERGYIFLVVDGHPFSRYRVPVEDDSEFLFDAYLGLKARIAGDGQLLGEHHACLGEGRVQFGCFWQGAGASIEIRILDEALGHALSSEIVRTSLENYVGAWHRMIVAMVSELDKAS